ncbi:hypothetical protein Tco_0666451 [Tanacetum coccineum]
MRVEESLNLTFDETPPSPKTLPLEDDDLVEEEAIEVNKTRPLGNDVEDKSLENNEIVNIKESKSHQLEIVIGDLNQRTLRSQAQDKSIELRTWDYVLLRGLTLKRISIYADSDHAGDYVDRKSTSGICTFMGCCSTSWFSKKQTALTISTTKVEYVIARKACQQALWMKQALVDYGICLDDIPIMCDNKGAID